MALRYRMQMFELTERVALIREMAQNAEFTMSPYNIRTMAQLEAVCLQLRMALELVVYASLLANENRVAELEDSDDLGKFEFAKKLLKRLERHHPGFFPIASVIDVKPGHVSVRMAPAGSALTKEDFVTLYDACCELLHSPNPYRESRVVDFQRPILEWVDRIESLVKVHAFHLWGGDTFLCDLDGDEDGGNNIQLIHIKVPTDQEAIP